MAPAQIALHLGPAQIEIAILEPNLLGGRLAVGNLKRHRRRRTQNLERTDHDLDFAGRKLGVDGALGAANDFALHRDIKFGTRLASSFVRGRIVRGIQHQLNDSIAVAQIDEDQAAVIASRLDPSPERDVAADV